MEIAVRVQSFFAHILRVVFHLLHQQKESDCVEGMKYRDHFVLLAMWPLLLFWQILPWLCTLWAQKYLVSFTWRYKNQPVILCLFYIRCMWYREIVFFHNLHRYKNTLWLANMHRLCFVRWEIVLVLIHESRLLVLVLLLLVYRMYYHSNSWKSLNLDNYL